MTFRYRPTVGLGHIVRREAASSTISLILRSFI